MRPIRLQRVILTFLLLSLIHGSDALHSGGAHRLLVTAAAGATTISWEGVLSSRGDGTLGASDLTTLTLGSLLLPGQLVALRVHGEEPVVPQITQLVREPWPGDSLPHLRSVTGAIAEVAPSDLPAAPFLLLREAKLRGMRIVVLALTPLFAEGAVVQQTRRLVLTVPHTEPLGSWSWGDVAEMRPTPDAPEPTNPAATLPAVKIVVGHAGLQRITAADLAAVGRDLSTIEPQQVRLQSRGVDVAIEVRGTGSDLELRFFAQPPGDRWNQQDYYWLTLEPPPLQGWARMAERSVAPIPGVPTRTSAVGVGLWHRGERYNSTRPGPDGDHWFSAELKSAPEGVVTTAAITLTTQLPVLSGPVQLTLAGSTAGSAPPGQGLDLNLGTLTQQVTWSGSADWSQPFSFDHYAPLLTVSARPAAQASTLLLDSVNWTLPVALQLQGNGASFRGVDGTWTYLLEDPPVDALLYDVSDPRLPVRLTGAAERFTDGPTARSYLLVRGDSLQMPQLLAHTPVDIALPMQATALYIAPLALLDTLDPLLAQRRGQGIAAQAIAVEAIYDAWSYGQVDPEAIRSFIRYATATWPIPPQAVIMVGDGSIDPLNYLGTGLPTLIPPYVAAVDPWLGETACETCFVRLDTTNPLDDPLPDLLIGRLPVKSRDELAQLIAKILDYEHAPISQVWRSKLVLVADDPDSAGDFIAAAEQAAMLTPEKIALTRLFYDPTGLVQGAIQNAQTARDTLLRVWGEGAGLVLYTGHSSQQQWASNRYQSDESGGISYIPLLRIYDQLGNGSRLPIVMAMSCLTGAFQTPYRSGMSLDEWLVLSANQGAVATWSSAGLGVSYGHDRLQRGFLRALWASAPLQARIGELAAAGYLELFTQGSCCQDALYHYLILGDPLTPARVTPIYTLQLPLIQN